MHVHNSRVSKRGMSGKSSSQIGGPVILLIELGLLRKRALSHGQPSAKSAAHADQPFSYLIVIDFESTCWQDGKFRTQEIIEFPAVLLNTRTGEVEDEFHYYVQPQEQPTLSSFCTELTGITQEQVDEGIPISLCLKKFVRWLNKVKAERGVVLCGARPGAGSQVTATCVTWSDWDLAVCLHYEFKRKQLLKPPQLTSWIDLRATYRKFYQRKPSGLNGALQDVGITFQGRQHSGLDDAKNTAKLAYRMIRDGCVLQVTKSLKGPDPVTSKIPTPTCPRMATINANSKRLQTPEKAVKCHKRQKVGTPGKIPKRITPKKFSVGDIYSDPETSSESSSRKAKSPKTERCNKVSGLKVHDSNIPSHTDDLNGSYIAKKTPVKKLLSSNRDSAFKKPSPVGKRKSDTFKVGTGVKSGYSTISLHQSPEISNTKPESRKITPCAIQTPKQSNQAITKYFTTPQQMVPLSRQSPVSTSSHKTPVTVANQTVTKCFTTPQQPQINQRFTTPCNTSTNQFKTPNNQSTMKLTPPLCNCHRRSKRRMVQSPGQNMGRFFFTCAVRQGVGKKGGCEFFKWEPATAACSTVSQRSVSVISKQFTPVVNHSAKNFSSVQRKSLGVRSITVSVTSKPGLR